jgi:hypothetical protein
MLSTAPTPCVIAFAISSPLVNVCVVAIYKILSLHKFIFYVLRGSVLNIPAEKKSVTVKNMSEKVIGYFFIIDHSFDFIYFDWRSEKREDVYVNVQ